MRRSTTARLTAIACAAGLALATPATANAQELGGIDTSSLGTSIGGSLALVGLPDLGSAAAGGECVAISPTIAPFTTRLNVDITSAEGKPGVAEATVGADEWFGQTQGTLHWENTTTGAKGQADFGPFGGDAAIQRLELATGAGTVNWSVDAHNTGAPLSVGLPLAAVGSAMPTDGSSTPYSACTGTVEIA